MTKSEKACRVIQSAKKESQVVGAVRDYLDSLDASDVAQLPAEVAVLGLTPAEELIQSALQALHNCLAEAGATRKGGIVRETALVFTTAARQLTLLAEDSHSG